MGSLVFLWLVTWAGRLGAHPARLSCATIGNHASVNQIICCELVKALG